MDPIVQWYEIIVNIPLSSSKWSDAYGMPQEFYG